MKRTLNAIGARVTPWVPRWSDGSGCSGLAATRKLCKRPTKKWKAPAARAFLRDTRVFPMINEIKLSIRPTRTFRSSSLKTAVGKLASGLNWFASGHTFGTCRIAYRFPATTVLTNIVIGLTTTCGVAGYGSEAHWFIEHRLGVRHLSPVGVVRCSILYNPIDRKRAAGRQDTSPEEAVATRSAMLVVSCLA